MFESIVSKIASFVRATVGVATSMTRGGPWLLVLAAVAVAVLW